MAEIIFNCPICESEIQADETLAGGMVQCPQCSNSIMIPMPGITPGMNIAGFRIIKKLGSGGMGEVWLAEQTAMSRPVALKILSPALTDNPNFVERFMAEVKVSAKLQHPNIVTAFDAGNENGIYYLAVSFVDGSELDDILKTEKKLSEKRALEIIRSIAEALDYAWNKFKILHRDIKPSNIMIENDGGARLMDMGISKSMAEDSALTMTGVIVGTPYYMSPEQARAEAEIDFRADIYSLGTTLYQLVTGEVPFDATTAMGILAKHITDPLPSPTDKNPELSEFCTALIIIMMAKNREKRQKSWKEVIKDIDLVLKGEMPATPIREEDSPLQTTISQALRKRQITTPPKAELSGTVEDYGKRNFLIKPLKITLAFIIFTGIFMVGFRLARTLNENSMQKPPMETHPRHAEYITPTQNNNIVFDTAKATEMLENMTFNENDPEDEGLRKEKEKKLKEIWKLSVNFADNNPDMPEMAISNFKKIIQRSPDGSYTKMAENKIREIKQRAKTFRDSRIKQIVEKLSAAAAALEKENKLKEAKEIYLGYSGEYAMETARLRHEKAELLAKKALLKKEEEEQRLLELEKAKDDFFNSIARALLKGDFQASLRIFAESKLKKEMPELKSIINELENKDRLVLDSLKEDIGKYILIDTGGKREKVKLKKIKGGTLYYIIKMGKATIRKKLFFKKISERDKLKRLSGRFSNPAMAVYRVRLCLKFGKAASAEKYTKNIPEPLKSSIKRQLNLYMMGKKEGEAKNEYAMLLRKNGIRNPMISLSELKRKIADLDYSQNKINKIKNAVKQFSHEYGDTKFYDKKKEFLKHLLPPKADLEKIFHARITHFNKDNLEVELIYDFSDEKQLRDWIPMRGFHGIRQNFYIQDKALLLESKEHGGIFFKAEFAEVEVDFRGSFTAEFNSILEGDRDSIGFIVGGFGGRADGFVKNIMNRDREFIRMGLTRIKQGDTVEARLEWKNQKASFSCEEKNWPVTPLPSNKIQFGFMLRGAENKYYKVKIRGILDRNWYEKNMEL